jgi:exodeoxyribonuclease VII small subunit
MSKQPTYESAYEELKEIASAIEDETITVDVLAEKLKRAAALIQFCKAKLKSTEDEVSKILGEMRDGTEL